VKKNWLCKKGKSSARAIAHAIHPIGIRASSSLTAISHLGRIFHDYRSATSSLRRERGVGWCVSETFIFFPFAKREPRGNIHLRRQRLMLSRRRFARLVRLRNVGCDATRTDGQFPPERSPPQLITAEPDAAPKLSLSRQFFPTKFPSISHDNPLAQTDYE